MPAQPTPPMLVDSHCHLDFPDFDSDRDAVISRAGEAGVGLMVSIGTTLAGFPKIRTIAEQYDSVYCTVGVHPHEAANEPDVDCPTLTTLADHPKVVGIGETGLDYHYDNAPRDAQREKFRAHIAAARETGLPIIVHSRNADSDTADILEETGEGELTGLLHCFSAGEDLARRALDIGFYISLSGIVTFKNAGSLRDIARKLPLERILVETDSPYLAPVPHRGRRNEPAFVADTARLLAEERAMPAEEFARITTDNFFRLFRKIPPQA